MGTSTTTRASSTREHVERKQPETLRLRAVWPAVTVHDIDVSIAWYRDVLGFVLVEEWRHDETLMGARMRAGTVDILLGQDDFAKGRERSKGIGFRIYCTTAQDVDALAAAVTARGGQLAQQPTTQPWGVRDFALTDPDGFKISIGNWDEQRTSA